MSNRQSLYPFDTPNVSHSKPTEENMREWSKRFSQIPPPPSQEPDVSLSAMQKKFMAVRLKNYRPMKSNYSKYVALFFVLVGFFGAYAVYQMSLFDQTPQRNFCDTDDIFGLSGCEPCPPDAECFLGRIVRCQNDKIIRGFECVPNEKMLLLKSQMLEHLEDQLARLHGAVECGELEVTKQSVKLSDIGALLRPAYEKKEHFKEALESLTRDFSNAYSKVSGLSVSQQFVSDEGFVTFLEATTSKFTVTCKLKMFYFANFFAIWGSIILALSLIFIIVKKRQEKKYVGMAEDLYRTNLVRLKSEGRVNIRNLLDCITASLSKSERDFIANKLESIRKIDEQVTTMIDRGEKYCVLI